MDNCWKCGDPTHHSRACPSSDVGSGERREVQVARRAVEPLPFQAKGLIQLQKSQEKQKIRSEPPPPEKLMKNEIHRLHNNLCEWELDLDDVPDISIDVDCLEKAVGTLCSIKEAVSSQNSLVRFVEASVSSAEIHWKMDEELQFLRSKVDTLRATQRRVNDVAYVKYNNYKIAMIVVKTLNTGSSEITAWVEEAKAAFSGRPLQIKRIKEEWPLKKKVLTEMKDLLTKYSYIFSDSCNAHLRTLVESTSKAWRAAKEEKIKFEKPDEKTLCPACQEKDVQVVLSCGHPFCGTCVEAMQNCGMCRAPIANMTPIYWAM